MTHYSDLELRVIDIQKAGYGSPEHRKLVLMLVELVRTVLPLWERAETTPASCVRAAQAFGDGKKGNRGVCAQLLNRILKLEQTYDYATAPLEHRIVTACYALLRSVYQPLYAKQVLDNCQLAYIEANFGLEPLTLGASVDRHTVLADEFDVKAAEIVARHFPQD